MARNDTGTRTRSIFARPRGKDGRKQFLVYMLPRLKTSIKAVALKRGIYAYELVEELLTEALDRLADPIVAAIDLPAGYLPDAEEGADAAMATAKKEE